MDRGPEYLKRKVQSEQLEACRVALGHKSMRWSTNKLLEKIKWISVDNILTREAAIAIHRIIHSQNSLYLHYKMVEKVKINQGENQIKTRRTGPG